MIKGHVTICKIYKDGTQETVLDRANLITAGLGSSFLDIQQGKGSTVPSDYCPTYFQLGTSSIDYDVDKATSSFYYQVSTAFDWDTYGEDTDLSIEKKYRGFNASTEDGGATYGELFGTSAALSAIVFSGSDEYFAAVQPASITKYFMEAFEAQFVLDENSANGQAITEIGLFARNPKGFSQESPLLMAYRSFAPLNKTEEFSLVINWTIGFLGLNPNIDDHYIGGGGGPTAGRPTFNPIHSITTSNL